MTNRIDFTVTGDEQIRCSGCESRIHFALQRLSGVQHVAVDAKTRRVAVTFDPALLSSDQIEDRLKELGFDAEAAS